ncbi:MAG: hypothetical protein ACD_75C02205G0002 [uncultured bacterium]|nr:MAG: hypothetical protein ACD_75C02205G0002 [uncultured bacterium]
MLHPLAMLDENLPDIIGIHPDIAAQIGPIEPQHALRRIELVFPDVLDGALGDEVQGDALPGIVSEACPEDLVRLFQQMGIVAFTFQGGDHERTGEVVPVGEQHMLAGHVLGVGLIEVGVIDRQEDRLLLFPMISEGADRRLDPGLVADARIVAVKRQDQVRLVVAVHDFLEVFHRKGVGRTLEGSHEYRIDAFSCRNRLGRFDNLRGIFPVDLLEEGLERCDIIRLIVDHVLKVAVDAHVSENPGDIRIKRRREQGVGPADKDHADLGRAEFCFPYGIALFQVLAVGPVEFHRPLVGRGDLEKIPPAWSNLLQHPVELHLGVPARIEVLYDRPQHPPFVLPGHPGDETRQELGVVTVLPPGVLCLVFQVEGHEEVVGAVEEQAGMAVHGGHGGAELRLAELFALLQGLVAFFAGQRRDAKRVKKFLPQMQVVDQMDGGRQADGQIAALRLPGEPAQPFSFPQQVEGRRFTGHVVLGVVVAATEEAIGNLLVVDGCNRDLAVVGAELAGFAGNRDRF